MLSNLIRWFIGVPLLPAKPKPPEKPLPRPRLLGCYPDSVNLRRTGCTGNTSPAPSAKAYDLRCLDEQ
jgi:hypothetical protein